ncbi:tRNA (adenosine(37)-N6)-threonylcarbamoyltransferase complex transferase subunit TsaD [Asticcacaulis sp. 201]|uniref:tRNA (adenosine(37)-N6)-threonylcarbamoyltransferase complex transferase subunit TsaD n=1 Tax=Asticcacaulis sp. 201 TaxID=3028787 RepID=UPI002916DFFC|nr:tRNA (adenosine(37)-N6)-threonylcarbamoyltransferase complex transferase subunit TsaD [Asticcacaulis sp. 201]MDV6332356.1 tRNA (adenosine(37)-N6)-threonylcarbamoyltransferase complex transferase subunit TsaD [Asticcacaulis sp. 201]
MTHSITVLGIESSCDETAVAVVRRDATGTHVLSSVIHSQVMQHKAFGGVVPEIAARSHVETIDDLAARALAEAGQPPLDLVAATSGPGLIGGVMVGLSFAKGFALARNLPLIGINHLEGHALSARLSEDVAFPFLLLLISGGHCQLLSVTGVGDYARLGTTIDDAAGEAFDKIAKVLGLGYPGGPALEAEALKGDAARFTLPRALLGRKDCDFSFSGLKTAAALIAYDHVKTAQDRADLCAGVQAAITRQLVERSERAMALFKAQVTVSRPAFVVAGGVAANQAIRAALTTVADRNGFELKAPPLKYCTDNAAMIALAGLEHYEKLSQEGHQAALPDMNVGMATVARPRWPLDEISAANAPIHKYSGRKGAKA